ncbi:class I SAM-dependent methyltransferase [Sphaerisporangium rubeum]|uniref:Methyltransferase MycE N-terminal domain-containing protein n=1 Tax=Sphaerisporangium rubeum TaxID=321317 RepID=A0A7X0IGS2_9ACTN|nr:hypothetical protein [Sphaerisporangium rubeum]
MIGTETPIRRLLSSAGGTEDEIRAVIDEIGEECAAAILVDEIAARFDPPALDREYTLRAEFPGARQVHAYTFTVSSAGLTAVPADGRPPDALVACDLAALTRAVYGGGRRAARAEVLWPDGERLGAALASVHSLGRAVEAVVTACHPPQPENLDRLATRYGTDKYGTLHWYTPHYARYLAPLRDRPVRLLEIGVGGYQDPAAGGASLRMWQRYFPRGLIYGLDLFGKTGVRGPRIRTLQGDQGDPAALRALAAEHGPFDIVIDDGSHLNEHVLLSLRELFPHVRPGGLYVVEDTQTSYWPAFGGGGPTTTMEFAKTLIDGLQHREFTGPGHSPSLFDRHVVAVHFHHNLMVVEKGDNDEQGAPSWIPRGG